MSGETLALHEHLRAHKAVLYFRDSYLYFIDAFVKFIIEPRHEKTCLQGFRPGKT